MPDRNFFDRHGPLTLKEISDISGASLAAGADPGFLIEDVAPLDAAGPKDLSFLDNVRYKDQFAATKAGACLVSSKMAEFAPPGTRLLISESPYKAYALVARAFYPETLPLSSIPEKSCVHPSAKIGKGCVIEPGAVVMEGAKIGEACRIEANAVIGRNVVLGGHCRVGANASVSHALIGSHVRVYPGARIGQDGFGFAIDPAGHVKVPQLGRVIIEDHVEIGANTTIDRGSGPDTVIGQGTWIDNLVQIGHNVRIGKGCVIVALVGISGSAEIGDYVAIGGQAGVAGHLRIGKGAKIGAQSGVMRDLPAGEEYLGSPALPKRQFMRQITALGRLVKKGERDD